jgi:hypothetical protein
MARPLQVARYAAAAVIVAGGQAFAIYLVISASLSGNCFEGAGSNCDSSTGSSLASSLITVGFAFAVVTPVIAVAAGIALGVDRSQALGWVRFGLLVVLLLPLCPVAGVAAGLLVNYAGIGITAGVGVALAAVVAYLAAWSTLARVLRQGREPLEPEVSRPSAMG